ncbi:thiaminase II [Zhouia sp. PK063]|uniref:thiaminase II n=1 Tax=Zhouia sp. PK063 TaxID=3373602 RepID=UPI00378984C8
MMLWSNSAWENSLPVYQKIIVHPFISELKEGTLPEAIFKFYIQQDALYLADFGKVLSGIASKLTNPNHIQEYLKFSSATILVENALHETFLKQFNITSTAQKSPSCLMYTNYMHAQFATQPLEVAMAAVLPCFWIYKEVGDYIQATQTKKENTYQNWIDTYGGEEFAASVQKAIEITNHMAASTTAHIRLKMTEAFLMASKMEWLFWDSAYQQETWKI